MENPIKMDDLVGFPLLLETPIYFHSFPWIRGFSGRFWEDFKSNHLKVRDNFSHRVTVRLALWLNSDSVVSKAGPKVKSSHGMMLV